MITQPWFQSWKTENGVDAKLLHRGVSVYAPTEYQHHHHPLHYHHNHYHNQNRHNYHHCYHFRFPSVITLIGTPKYGKESPSQAAMLSQDLGAYQQQLGFNSPVTQSEYDRYVGHKELKKKQKKKISNRHLLPPRSPSTEEHRVGVTSHSVSSLSPNRETRTCVLRKIAERTLFNDYWNTFFNQWRNVIHNNSFPVTDSIALGYPLITTNPTNFSTIKQKIDDNSYRN
ncbi:unnamed protein product [Heterotrigona itama]|uniref:Uncharacterized protein n=1 Tax=Heterotrigona itama TaxID=395501 RepID=A0A6V7GXF2_9HYME|nr:unnamed protein product [Heterotrigona itama]